MHVVLPSWKHVTHTPCEFGFLGFKIRSCWSQVQPLGRRIVRWRRLLR